MQQSRTFQTDYWTHLDLGWHNYMHCIQANTSWPHGLVETSPGAYIRTQIVGIERNARGWSRGGAQLREVQRAPYPVLPRATLRFAEPGARQSLSFPRIGSFPTPSLAHRGPPRLEVPRRLRNSVIGSAGRRDIPFSGNSSALSLISGLQTLWQTTLYFPSSRRQTLACTYLVCFYVVLFLRGDTYIDWCNHSGFEAWTTKKLVLSIVNIQIVFNTIWIPYRLCNWLLILIWIYKASIFCHSPNIALQ